METLFPSSYFPTLNFLMQESRSTEWTKEENKKFEKALAIYDENTPDRWVQVAAMIPGKSVSDVRRQYMELESDVSDIEAGLVPDPGYLTSSFTLELMENGEFDVYRKRPLPCRSLDQERKKGVPWTEEEHRRFLMGLQKHGKGDWRNISRNFVITKTPTQVASHAQKYFLRLNSGDKDKRRPSIHDITTVHLKDTPSPDHCEPPPSLNKSTLLTSSLKDSSTPKVLLNWNHSNDGGRMVFGSTHGNSFLQRGAYFGAQIGSLNPLFQIQSTRYRIHG